MNISSELRKLIIQWRNKPEPHPHGEDFVGRELARNECADDLEEFLNCNRETDFLEIA